MDLIKAFFGGEQKTKALGLPSQAVWNFYNGVWMPYEQNNGLYIDKAYKMTTIVQAIVSQIIQKASEAPPEIYRIRNEKAYKAYQNAMRHIGHGNNLIQARALRAKAFEEVSDHPMMEVYHNPNSMYSGKDFRENSLGYLLLTGNAFEYASTTGVGARGLHPKELWNIPSPCVGAEFTKDRRNPIKGYTISYDLANQVDPRLMTHLRYFNPITDAQNMQDSFWGLSPLHSARNLMSQKRDADITQGTLFKNASPAGLITGSGSDGYNELTEEQALAINKAFKDNHMGSHNAGDIIVTPANVRWEQIGLSPVDLQLMDFNGEVNKQIARLYSYPQEYLEASAIVANSSEGSLKFIRNTVAPVLYKYDASQSKSLRTWFNDPTLVYQSDMEYYQELQPDKAELVKWMRNASVFTQAEIRRALDYDESYDEKEVLAPVNFMFLSDLRARSEMETTQPEPAPPMNEIPNALPKI